jgi:hypothetical protein
VTAKQRAFLAAYSKVGIISEAAKKAKISRRDHCNWLPDPEYAAAFEVAREESIELLELTVRRRAMRARKPSDLLSMFLLKAARPEKYRDNARVEMTGAGGAPIQVEVKFVTPKPTT